MRMRESAAYRFARLRRAVPRPARHHDVVVR
jgi:hypothetical protein